MNESKAVREIHEIREITSREKKGLSISECVTHANANADELKKYGIKVINFI